MTEPTPPSPIDAPEPTVGREPVGSPEPATLREPGQRLHPRVKVQWLLSEALGGLVLLAAYVVLTMVWDAVPMRWWILLPLVVLALFGVLVVPPVRYAVHRWEVTETAVYTQTGWLSIEQRIAPMSRIQTVDYEESFVQRLFGLASVEVTTASASGSLSIAGLDKQVARELAERLTRRADAVPGDAT